ncbi:MAG TPA: 4Fe-4S binding protein [Gammaproteobacteria bacterium]|nr:4Fe-4S binding protein [Gammaproteobacteria bacterium]
MNNAELIVSNKAVSELSKHRPLRRYLNKLRWLSLCLVFAMLIILPLLSVYQTYVASHGYRLLSPSGKHFYDVMQFFTSPFTDDPANSLDAVKGSTWSGNFFGFKISDPLAVLGQIAAAAAIYPAFLITALTPILFSVLFGRFYCGWICPATLLYELNTNLAVWLQKLGFRPGHREFARYLKYFVLMVCLVVSALTGTVVVAVIYPPAIIGRELYYALALGGFGAGTVFFMLTLLFDILVARRGFCRYLCPGGALYSLLGRYRLLRIQRQVQQCNDCAKCNAVCEFGLNPMRDDFGQECNNCCACIAICPTDALIFSTRVTDISSQGAGHLGPKYRKLHLANTNNICDEDAKA